MMQIPDDVYGCGEDPFTCPFDGSRTTPVKDNGKIYMEFCLNCGMTIAFDGEEEEV